MTDRWLWIVLGGALCFILGFSTGFGYLASTSQRDQAIAYKLHRQVLELRKENKALNNP